MRGAGDLFSLCAFPLIRLMCARSLSTDSGACFNDKVSRSLLVSLLVLCFVARGGRGGFCFSPCQASAARGGCRTCSTTAARHSLYCPHMNMCSKSQVCVLSWTFFCPYAQSTPAALPRSRLNRFARSDLHSHPPWSSRSVPCGFVFFLLFFSSSAQRQHERARASASRRLLPARHWKYR